jgi:hypothetical protein
MNSKVLLIKDLIKEIPDNEWEDIRDELLSILLFSDLKEAAGPINKDTGLSEYESKLIKKLASQTENLYKLYKCNKGPDNG